MAVNWSGYESRINLNGNTQRERTIAKLKNDIIEGSVNSPSYKQAYINGVRTNVVINSTTDVYIKTFVALPDDDILAGTVIQIANKNWLATSADPDGEVYISGKLEYCNRTLNFLNAEGNVVSRPCVVMNATRYNAGIKQDNYMTVGTTQFLMKLPLDEDTIHIDRTYSDGKDRRVLLDIDTGEPMAYKVTHTDRLTYPGIVELTLVETERSEDDNLDLCIADYYSRVSPTPSTSEINITYSGLPVLEVGKGYKTFVYQSDISFNPIWSVVTPDEKYDQYVLTESSDDYIKIKVTSPVMIGMPITLQVKNADNTLSASLELKVKGI